MYGPLPTPDSVRLLYVDADLRRNAPLVASLRTVRLSENPSYVALSYVWGDPTLSYTIQVDGSTLCITQSLDHALRDIRALAIRHRCRPDPLWVDAVCINQADVAERNQQVACMGDIYRLAFSVTTYIGTANSTDYGGIILANKLTKFASQRGGVFSGSWNVIPESEAELFEIPLQEDPSWAALGHLLQRDWASRVWIVQESLVAARHTMMCGQVELQDWMMLPRLAFLSLNDKIPPIPMPPGKGVDYLNLQMDLMRFKSADDYPHARTFYHLLRMCHCFQSSNPRDKVYALLGVAQDRYEMGIMPDYEQPVEEVYTKVATRLIKTHANLDLFSSVYSEKTLSLPTWVPDWSSLPENARETLLNNPILMEHGLLNASRNTIADFSFQQNGAELTLQGGVIDRVAIVEENKPELPPGKKMAAAQPFFLEHMDYLASLPLYKSCGLALAKWQNLLQVLEESAEEMENPWAGCRYIWAAKNLAREFISKLTGVAQPGNESHNWLEEVRRLWVAYIHTCSNRKLFITDGGYIGLGPQNTRVGDLAVVFLGGKVPCVLRRRADGKCELIGESYVHAMMEGEALDLVGLEDLTLV